MVVETEVGIATSKPHCCMKILDRLSRICHAGGSLRTFLSFTTSLEPTSLEKQSNSPMLSTHSSSEWSHCRGWTNPSNLGQVYWNSLTFIVTSCRYIGYLAFMLHAHTGDYFHGLFLQLLPYQAADALPSAINILYAFPPAEGGAQHSTSICSPSTFDVCTD